jgi:hypothetical protein
VSQRAGETVDWGASQGQAVLKTAGDAYDAGKAAAVQAYDSGKAAAVQAYDASKKAVTDAGLAAKKAALDTYQAGKAKASEMATAAGNFLPEKVGQLAVKGARAGTQAAVKNPETLDALTNKVDKRNQFEGPVCQECIANKLGKHPDPDDGKYLGKDCPKIHDTRPAEGTLPHKTPLPTNGSKPSDCTCDKSGKPFPRIFFTNGIANSPEQACATMHALATSRCVEVIGIYNASYGNNTLKAPEGPGFLGAARNTAKEAWRGDTSSGAEAVSSSKLPLTIRALQGVAGAASGGLEGAFKGALDEAAGFASRTGEVGDVLDCLDAIKGTSDEAASRTLTKEILEAMKTKSGMTVYAHSQGGLNTMASIAQAKGDMLAVEEKKLLNGGISEEEAGRQAKASVESALGSLKVSTFGTVERGFADGPEYSRFTNNNDPIPVVIRTAQENISRAQLARDPKGALPVDRFTASPSFNPIAAHGMAEAYIPHLNKKLGASACC